MELCSILQGQPYRAKLDKAATKNMINAACKPPGQNYTAIKDGLSTLGFTKANESSALAGFGIEIDENMTTVHARILDAPTLQYGDSPKQVLNGSWNLRGLKFREGASLDHVAILVLETGKLGTNEDAEKTKIQLYGKDFTTACVNSGMSGNKPLRVRFAYLDDLRVDEVGNFGKIEQKIKEAINSLGAPPRLILAFLPTEEANLYQGFKRLCDIELGIASVCVLRSKVETQKNRIQYFANVAQKVNTKLGGINHSLDPTHTEWLANTMLVGMDVTHPPAALVKKISGLPSIAAVVASCDDTFMRYPASLRLQRPDKGKLSKEVRFP
jgi:hypothetical protein